MVSGQDGGGALARTQPQASGSASSVLAREALGRGGGPHAGCALEGPGHPQGSRLSQCQTPTLGTAGTLRPAPALEACPAGSPGDRRTMGAGLHRPLCVP